MAWSDLTPEQKEQLLWDVMDDEARDLGAYEHPFSTWVFRISVGLTIVGVIFISVYR